MRIIQPKTFVIINRILQLRIFSQRGVWESCNEITDTSIGQVNKVFKELIGQNLIRKRSKMEMKYGIDLYENVEINDYKRTPQYYLQDPIGLLRYISLFRPMEKLKVFELNVEASREEVMDKLKEYDAIFSLGIAMERFSTYYRSDQISLYAENPKSLHDDIKNSTGGNTTIACYDIDFLDKVEKRHFGSIFEIDEDNIKYSGDVQTVIDMFCDGKSAYTKTLLKRIWGVNI